MFRKKLPFKEDKNDQLTQTTANLHVIQPFEESKHRRGRQLNHTNNIEKKEAPKPFQNQSTTCESKNQIKYKTINHKFRNKTDKILSKNYQDQVEEEQESSEDSFYQNKKKKHLSHEELNFKTQIIEIYSSNNEDNLELSDDMNFNYDDVLNNEIEKILIDIYNSNITKGSETIKKMDVRKYESNISLYSKKLNKQYNIFMLQILSDKIKELVKRYKEKIFEIPEIRKLRDLYYEYKRIYSTNHESSDDSQNSKSLSPRPRKDPHLENKMRLEESESICQVLLSELYNIKKCLMKSSKDIEKIFRLPLDHCTVNNKILRFNVEEMHKEEFFSTLLNDEFIAVLLLQVKTIFKCFKIEEIRLLINKIEDGNSPPKLEMTKFSDFLMEKLKSFIESDFVDDEQDNYCENEVSDEENPNTLCKSHEILIESTKNGSNSKKQIPKQKIANDIGLDELLEYIVKDENPKKTSKKKNKKKKTNKKSKEDDKNNLNLHNLQSHNTIDQEVEKFKQILNENRAKCYKKIKPNISNEWITRIVKLVNVNNL